ncbi:hypothetical protein C7S20_08345 [Christiangramia fulva]|uniref:Exostosin GT47 domain-containing protein n=1 Tax=Christiangramia fulva TaxID=2126553 RepID=A0A2R3Z4R7_9FLAO|nr:exostosin family protein [Christiangramia fulva]AVR45273.1 hypothetical protein C7S20_08345 [Christiangramia fulva]
MLGYNAMKVYLLSAYPLGGENITVNHVKESALMDPFGVHELVDDPKNADLIIFVENHPGCDPYFFNVLKNSVYRVYKEKCVLYHDNDRSLTFLPTISPSLEKSYFNQNLHRPFPYITQLSRNPYIKHLYKNQEEKIYLFSFIGASRTHTVRKKIFKINYERCYLKDTSDKNSWQLKNEEKDYYFKKYAEICQKSKFILCPRGIGPNSYRLYESMEAGVAPVIISDDWIPSQGPKWKEFSIQVRESDVSRIEEILLEKEVDYKALGLKAREVWEDYFSKDKQFHYLVETAYQLQSEKGKKKFLRQYIRFTKSSFHLRNLIRFTVKKMFLGLESLWGLSKC